MIQHHIHVHEQAIKKLREANNIMLFLNYDRETLRKLNKPVAYIEKRIERRIKQLEESLRAYDAIVSTIIDDHSENPILERYGH